MSEMDGWIKKPLSEVADITMGQSPDSKFYSEEDVGMPFLQGCAEFGSKYPSPKINCTQIKKIGKCGSILFSVRAPVGKTNLADRDYIIGRGLASILATDVDSAYLEQFIAYVEHQFRIASQGSTFEAINTKELSAWPIGFPCDPVEQTQIATILFTLDRAIEQTEAIIAKQQRIKAGLMQDLLTKGIDKHGVIRSEATHEFKDSSLGRIPVEWEVEALGSVIEIIDPNPSHRYPPSSDVGVPIASTENFVGDNDFDLSWAERVPLSVFEKQRRRCNYIPDDVIFARKGRLGFARPYGNEDKVFSHTVVVLKPRNGSVSPRFILWMVRFRQFFDEIDKRMNSNSGVPTLGVAFIGAVPVLIPKPEEQARIVDLLNNAEVAAEKELMQLQKLKKVKTGLMHDLLTGTVRVN